MPHNYEKTDIIFGEDRVVVQKSPLSHLVTPHLPGNDFANEQEKHSLGKKKKK